MVDKFVHFMAVSQPDQPNEPGFLDNFKNGFDAALTRDFDSLADDPNWKIRRVFFHNPFGLFKGRVKNEGGVPLGKPIDPATLTMLIDQDLLLKDRTVVADFEDAILKRKAKYPGFEPILYYGNFWHLTEMGLNGDDFVEYVFQSLARGIKVGATIAIDASSDTRPGSNGDRAIRQLVAAGVKVIGESWPTIWATRMQQLGVTIVTEFYDTVKGQLDSTGSNWAAPKSKVPGEWIQLAIHPEKWDDTYFSKWTAKAVAKVLKAGDTVAAHFHIMRRLGWTRALLSNPDLYAQL